MRLHRFRDHDEIKDRASTHGRSLDEIYARRERIRQQMAAVAAAARKHCEDTQQPTTVDTYA